MNTVKLYLSLCSEYPVIVIQLLLIYTWSHFICTHFLFIQLLLKQNQSF